MQKKSPIVRFDLIIRSADKNGMLNTTGPVRGYVCLTTSRPYKLRSLLVGLTITHQSEEINEKKTRSGKQQYFEKACILFGNTRPEASEESHVLEGGDYRFNFEIELDEELHRPTNQAKENATFLWSNLKACLIDKKGRPRFANVKLDKRTTSMSSSGQRDSVYIQQQSSTSEQTETFDKENEKIRISHDENRNGKTNKDSGVDFEMSSLTQNGQTEEVGEVSRTVETEDLNNEANESKAKLKEDLLGQNHQNTQVATSILSKADNHKSETVNKEGVTSRNDKFSENGEYCNSSSLDNDSREPRVILSKDKDIVLKSFMQENFFSAGGTVSFSIQCENNSKKAFKMVHASLIEESNKTPTCWTFADSHNKGPSRRVVAAVMGPPVNPKEIVVWESGVIPAIPAKPQSWYTLKIELKTSVMSYLHMEIPVVIMNEPISPCDFI